MSRFSDISPKISFSTEEMDSSEDAFFRSEQTTIPTDWEIAFPLLGEICTAVFHTPSERTFGIVVYRFSPSEARFVLRGDLRTIAELAACLLAGEQIARHLDCSKFVTQEKVRPDWLDAASIFSRAGFEQLDESWIFECPFKAFARRLNRIMGMLMRHKVIPQEARISDLTEQNQLARAVLEEANLMDGFDFDNRLSAKSSKRISAEYSCLVWVGETLVGIMLVAPTQEDDTYEIPIRYVAPAYRRTWVNAMLIHSCVKHGESMGASTIRFNANSKTHHETIRLAEQAGCVRIASSHRYEKHIAADFA